MSQRYQITHAAELESLQKFRDFITDCCLEHKISSPIVLDLKLAVDEACTNIIKHAYDGSGTGEITVRIQILPGDLQISLHDSGKRFDFAAVQD